ncbi:gluconate 2-dehydrogenase subunit 3 family protein [Paraburkholderia sp. NPDC080076]|uniref:gluconate 2-dehydrogenase subunit 3 family protein n=1 Tax=Paraburkholderia sp. NPDC080076 TaxID=3390605 RepID=UPI003CFBDAF4
MDDKPAAASAVPPKASSRRRFLIKSVAVLPVAGGLAACDRPGGVTASASASTSATAGTDGSSAKPYQPKFFKPDEWSVLQAAIDRLIPTDAEGPGALELDVAAFIDRQMEGAFGHAAAWYMHGPFHPDATPLAGYQSPMTPRDLYRTGIAALDAYCKAHFGGKPFVQLTTAQQDTLLHGMDSRKVKFEQTSAGHFIALLWQNTKEGYFSDPIHGGNKHAASWTMIGFPGARADYLDWVAQPGKVYPLGTVTIEGKA